MSTLSSCEQCSLDTMPIITVTSTAVIPTNNNNTHTEHRPNAPQTTTKCERGRNVYFVCCAEHSNDR